tara:strand:+ start:1570 stop:2886 length:1317 start_codon:yes stop_codon:yes gene_type:complete
MQFGLLIFLLAFTIRFINLLFLDLNVDNYLIEDQKFYWDWSSKGAYLPWSELPTSLLTERMPGSFLFFGFLQWLTNSSLFFVLVIQSIIDSFTCVIIFLCAGLLNKDYQLYTGLFAAFSPLMIIISSQILSDTIFLFTFSLSLYFILKYLRSKNSLILLYISALFLGISTFIRAATFPLIFLSLPIIFLILQNKINNHIRGLIGLFAFLLIALVPISHRLSENIIKYDTYSLTSQSGSHMAYWMVPGVLSISQGMDRKTAINLVNKELNNFEANNNEPYKDSKNKIKVSIDILKKQNYTDLTYAWLRSSIINILSSPIMIDYRVRILPHLSLAEESNIINWINKLFLNEQYHLYFIVLLLSLLFSIFSFYSIILGYYFFIKNSLLIAIISICVIIYFCVITGPTISPKYSLPYLPILLYLQGITIKKLVIFIKTRVKS